MMNEPLEQYKPAEKLELGNSKKEISKGYAKVSCPSCQESIPADNLNLQHSVAKCASCNVIFSIEKEIQNVKRQEEIKQTFIRPEGIELFHFQNNLDIVVQQHLQGVDLYGVIFAPSIAFLSFLIYLAKGEIMYIPIVFTLLSIYFFFRASNYSKRNKTYIDVNNEFLHMHSRPKNLKKDKTFAVEDIDQLYCIQAVDGTGYFTINMVVNGFDGQKHEKLLTVDTISKAKYLEQEIERYLQIENRKVPEENA